MLHSELIALLFFKLNINACFKGREKRRGERAPTDERKKELSFFCLSLSLSLLRASLRPWALRVALSALSSSSSSPAAAAAARRRGKGRGRRQKKDNKRLCFSLFASSSFSSGVYGDEQPKIGVR